MEQLLKRARSAQAAVAQWQQERVDQMVLAAGWHVYDEANAERLSNLAFRETGMGEPQETCARHRKRVLGILHDMRNVATAGFVEHIAERGLRKIAKPLGVVAAITPTTAPSAAVAQISLLALKTRNAVIFSPHPKALQTARATVEVLHTGLRQAGASLDLLQCVEESSRDQSEKLMEAADLILATGGRGTVHRAYSSGTPAYGAGVGNSVVVVDETADIALACRQIFAGKSFDNGTSCSSESCLVISHEVWDDVVSQLRHQGAHLCTVEEMQRLRAAAWPDGRTLSRAVVGRNASTIAKLAGISVPAGTRVLMAIPDGRPGEEPLGTEKLSPILSLWRYREFPAAVELVRTLIQANGRGHSCAIHTRSAARADLLAQSVDVSRVLVNQSTGFGNSGDFNNGLPFTTVLCCGTWGGSISNENVTWRHLLNYTWVSEPIADRTPSIEDIFEPHWSRFGRT